MIGVKRKGFMLIESMVSLLLVTMMILPMGKQVFDEFQQIQKIRTANQQAKTAYFQAEMAWKKTTS